MRPRTRHAIVLWREVTAYGEGLLSAREVAEFVGVHPDLVQRLVDAGVLDPAEGSGDPPLFGPEAVLRAGRILRIHGDLGVNLVGCGIVADLIERVEALERELERLRAAAQGRREDV